MTPVFSLSLGIYIITTDKGFKVYMEYIHIYIYTYDILVPVNMKQSRYFPRDTLRHFKDIFPPFNIHVLIDLTHKL